MNEKATALVIDDEPQIRKLLRILLEQEHYRALESDSGRHGLSEVALRRPDVVLLDLGLPDMDGLEVLKRLRQWSQVPVLILSVRDGPEDKVASSGCRRGRLCDQALRSHRTSSAAASHPATGSCGCRERPLRSRPSCYRLQQSHCDGRGPRDQTYCDRVCVAQAVGTTRWKSRYTEATAARDLGTKRGRAVAISAGLYDASAQENRNFRRTREIAKNGKRDRLSSRHPISEVLSKSKAANNLCLGYGAVP